MYNEQYIDARTLVDKDQKLVKYNDKYRTGYIYLYDDNRVLLNAPIDFINIIHKPAIRIESYFIWREYSDFAEKRFIVDNITYVMPTIGDYLIIHMKTGKYMGIIDKKYFSIYDKPIEKYYYPPSMMYDIDLKIEKYTGGMLEGYLYFKHSVSVTNLLKNHLGEYIFDHKIDIYVIPYIQESSRQVNESSIVNVGPKKTKIGYDDALLFGKDMNNIYGLDKPLLMNSIGYNSENPFETEIIADYDNQTIFKWRGPTYFDKKTIIELWVNGEKQPRKNYIVNDNTKIISLNNLKKTKLKAKVYLREETTEVMSNENDKPIEYYGVLEPIEEYDLIDNTITLINTPTSSQIIRIFINDIEMPNIYFSVIDNKIYFTSLIKIMKNDVIFIKLRYQNTINQYNKFDPLGI